MKKTGKKQDDERRKSAINDHSDGFLPPEAHGVRPVFHFRTPSN